MTIAECCTDLRLVHCKHKLRWKLIVFSCNNDPTPELMWANLKSAILKTSADVLGHTKNNKLDWFNENDIEIQDLLTEKRPAHQCRLAWAPGPVLKAIIHRACSNLQRKLEETENKWWSDLALRICWSWRLLRPLRGSKGSAWTHWSGPYSLGQLWRTEPPLWQFVHPCSLVWALPEPLQC